MAREIGTSGLEQHRGIVQEDFLKDLRFGMGTKGYKFFNEMRLNSPVVGALLMAIEQSIRGIDWYFTSETDNDPRQELLEEALDSMSLSWNDHITEVLTFLPFGFAPFEILYKREGARVLWRKFAMRGQDTLYRWEFDESGGLAGMWQQTVNRFQPVMIPIDKMIIYRARVEKQNPEGRSILRTAYTSYYYAKNIQQIEAIGIERDLAGLPVITLPESADTTETDSDSTDYGRAKRIVRNIRNDEQAGIVLPFEWKLELLSTGGSRQFDTDKIVSRYEKRILMASLAQFISLGMDSTGTYALSQDQTDFFNMSINAVADIITETFQKYAVPKLLRMNGYDAEGIAFEHSPAGDVNLDTFTKALQQAGSLITWTPDDEVMLRAMFGLPEKTVEEIADARTEAAAQRQAMFRQLQPGEEEEEEQDEFAAGRSPDDDQRREHEDQLEAAMLRFFSRQKGRIEREARKLRQR